MGALVLGGLCALIAYKMYHKPHKNIVKAEAVAIMTASEMLASYKNDEVAANGKYLDKILAISGTIASIKVQDNQISLQLDTGDPMSEIICNLDPFTKHKRTDFKVGEQVKLKGVCSGYLSDVVMDRCVEQPR